MLPQYANFDAAKNLNEVSTPSLYRVEFLPPASIADGYDLLSEYVKTVSGIWDDKNSSEVVQAQVGHIRLNYASDDPGDNTINFSITFSLFLNKDYSEFIYTKIRDWRRLVFDYETGIRGEKRNYVGGVIIEKLSRTNQIVGRRRVFPCFPINDMPLYADLDHTSTDPVEITVEFVGDDHEDLMR